MTCLTKPYASWIIFCYRTCFSDFIMLKEGLSKRFVGVPGMNSICKALCNENGIYLTMFFLFIFIVHS